MPCPARAARPSQPLLSLPTVHSGPHRIRPTHLTQPYQADSPFRATLRPTNPPFLAPMPDIPSPAQPNDNPSLATPGRCRSCPTIRPCPGRVRPSDMPYRDDNAAHLVPCPSDSPPPPRPHRRLTPCRLSDRPSRTAPGHPTTHAVSAPGPCPAQPTDHAGPPHDDEPNPPATRPADEPYRPAHRPRQTDVPLPAVPYRIAPNPTPRSTARTGPRLADTPGLV